VTWSRAPREALEVEVAAHREEAASLQTALERMALEAQREAAARECRHQQDIQVLSVTVGYYCRRC